MSESPWKDPKTAPKNKTIILNTGYPWATIGHWNEHDEKWNVVELQASQILDTNKKDVWFENEQELEIKGWMDLPEIDEPIKGLTSMQDKKAETLLKNGAKELHHARVFDTGRRIGVLCSFGSMTWMKSK